MQKHRLLSAVTAMLLLTLLFSSCGGTGIGGAESEIFYTESEPALPDFSDTETAETQLSPETKITDIQTEETETEAQTALKVRTEPVTEPLTEALPEITEAETEPPQPDRIVLRKFVLEPLEDVTALLKENGLSYTVTYEYSEYKKDSVIHASFRGTVEEDCYSVSPRYPVDLIVSDGPEPKDEIPWFSNIKAPDRNRVYLTFDDGPSEYTGQFLAVLEQYGVRATFFTVGDYIDQHPERLRAVFDAGHAIGCHSYSHEYDRLYASVETVTAEAERWRNAVRNALGTLPEAGLFRYPGGSNTSHVVDTAPVEIYWKLKELGFRCFDWTFADNDRYPQEKKPDQTMEDYLKWSVKVTLGLLDLTPDRPKIMLMHDTSGDTLQVLPWIIEFLTEKGYSFGTLDELDGDWLFYYPES